MYGYIYKTVNKQNGKIYVGQHKHSEYDKTYLGSGKLLKRAILKYGKDSFINEIIEVCENQKELDEKEKYFIKILDTTNKLVGYNLLDGGQGGVNAIEYLKKSGRYESWRLKRVGSKNPMYKSGEKGFHPKGMLGKYQSSEYKKRLSVEMTIKERNPMENGQVIWGVTHKHPRGMSGHNQTDHQKEIASKTQKGIKKPEGFGEKVSKRLKGKKKTKESIEKRRKTLADKPPIKKICVNCGKEYFSKASNSMYCSSQCGKDFRSKKIPC